MRQKEEELPVMNLADAQRDRISHHTLIDQRNQDYPRRQT